MNISNQSADANTEGCQLTSGTVCITWDHARISTNAKTRQNRKYLQCPVEIHCHC